MTEPKEKITLTTDDYSIDYLEQEDGSVNYEVYSNNQPIATGTASNFDEAVLDTAEIITYDNDNE